ncbi:DUF421 domain-containing protein [Cytobacillus oceanisediminis]|uniref:DUF421 domain-containing protein n=1 Tax=Cytobacillus oceanisediminis TaxID=665099 RepID=UPI00164350C4|nr:DUF421 domain-containing protein [Cytobacillus oceanisediminis]
MMYFMIAVKLVIGLAALIIVTRLLGKKEMSQVTPFDFVYAVVLGGLVEENLFKKSFSTIWEMLFGIGVWGLLIFVVEKTTQKSDKLRPILKGQAESLVKNGDIQIKNLNNAELEMEQLKSLLRLKGVFSMNDVKDVILETSGNISVLLKPQAQPPTYAGLDVHAPRTEIAETVVDEGKPVLKGLRNIGKDEKWLNQKLTEEGIQKLDEVYFAEWSESDGFFIQQKS